MKKKSKIIIIAVVSAFIILIIFAMVNKKGKTKKHKDVEVEAVFAVDTVKTFKGEINDYIALNGEIKASREVKVFPDQSGKIASITTFLGASIIKGQKILEIDPSRPGMIYSNSPVNSPITGTVTSLPFNVGETVNVQTPVAIIGNLNELEAIVNISEKYISKIKKGLSSIILVDAYPDNIFKGYIDEVSPVLDPASRMMEVKIKFNDEKSNLLKPGMFADVKIITENKNNIIKIPSQCISRRFGETFVFAVKDIPQEINNLTLQNKILPVLDSEENLFIKQVLPYSLPETLKIEMFEYRLLKSIKIEEDINLLKKVYILDNDLYRKAEDLTDSEIKKTWELLVQHKHSYFIPLVLDKPSATEIEYLRSILIKANILEKDDKYVKKILIKTGVEIDNKTEITSGLTGDLEIVYYGQSLLENNSKVKVIKSLTVLDKKDIIVK